MIMNRAITSILALAAVAGAAFGQASPPAQTSATIGGKAITIKYSAPSVKGRKIFGGAGALQPDNTVWRAGANNATSLHTDGDPARFERLLQKRQVLPNTPEAPRPVALCQRRSRGLPTHPEVQNRFHPKHLWTTSPSYQEHALRRVHGPA